MRRIERVKQFVEEYFAAEGNSKGLNSSTVAEALGIWRNDASADLAALVEQGVLRREGQRPVLFFPAARSGAAEGPKAPGKPLPPAVKHPFCNIIGYDGSLKLQVQLAKAAALYPPAGMHTLLIGETGVGKTMLAEEIWRYIQASHPEKKVPFVIFNCSEYTDNPQLLLSQLFGHEKGSFTGADMDKPGVIEKANGGVLFLDEIHRLPSTGQEMFFTVIDKGIYRRLGSTIDRHVELMIIGATTEKPESVLLNTFKRRIPMLIQLPNLGERLLKERFDLVILFLTQEARRLKLPIRISLSALKVLVAYESKMNIGDLRNEIQISCARGYLTYLNRTAQPQPEKQGIDIDIHNLSRKINTGYVWQETIDQLVNSVSFEDGVTIYPDQAAESESAVPSGMERSLDFYGFVESRINNYRKSSCSHKDIEQQVSLDLKKYYNEMVQSIDADPTDSTLTPLYTSISRDVAAVTSELIRLAEMDLGRTYSQGIRISVASFLEQTKSFARAGRVLFNQEMESIARGCKEEKEFVAKQMQMICDGLDLFLTQGEAAILALLLAKPQAQPVRTHIGLVIVAHGIAVASGMTSFVNQIIGSTVVQAIDIPIDCSPEQLLENLDKAVADNDKGNGIIIMSDMASASIVRRLHEKYTSSCHIIPFISIPLALEICKSILAGQKSVDEIALEVMAHFRENMRSVFTAQMDLETGDNGKRQKAGPGERNAIITYCVTGMGSARMAREILLREAGFAAMAEIIPLGIPDDIRSVAEKLGARLKLVVGYFDPGIEGVPFVGMEHLLTQKGLNRIKILLNRWSVDEVSLEVAQDSGSMSLAERLDHINRHVTQFAPSLPSDAVIAQASGILERVAGLYQEELPVEFYVRIYIHCITMFERLLTTQPIPMTLANIETVKRHAGFFNALKLILTDACQTFQLQVSDTEVYYLMATLPNPQSMEVDWAVPSPLAAAILQ